MNQAEIIMRQFNSNALIAREEDYIIMIEDVMDPDGRIYRIEYRSTPDAQRAIAFCIYNPWGDKNGGESYRKGHVANNGFLCLGPDHGDKELKNSPYDLKYAILRGRFWCTGFSVLKETGSFPNP